MSKAESRKLVSEALREFEEKGGKIEKVRPGRAKGLKPQVTEPGRRGSPGVRVSLRGGNVISIDGPPLTDTEKKQRKNKTKTPTPKPPTTTTKPTNTPKKTKITGHSKTPGRFVDRKTGKDVTQPIPKKGSSTIRKEANKNKPKSRVKPIKKIPSKTQGLSYIIQQLTKKLKSLDTKSTPKTTPKTTPKDGGFKSTKVNGTKTPIKKATLNKQPDSGFKSTSNLKSPTPKPKKVSGTQPKPKKVSGTQPKPKKVSGTQPVPKKVSGTPKKPMSRTEKVIRSTLGLGTTAGRRSGQAIRDKKGKVHGVSKRDQKLARNIRRGGAAAAGLAGIGTALYYANKDKEKDKKSSLANVTPPRKPKRGYKPPFEMEDPTFSKPKPRVDTFKDMPKKKKKPTKTSQEAKERKDQKTAQGRYRYYGKPGETIGDLSRKFEIKYDTKPQAMLPHEEGFQESNKRGGQIKGYKKGGKVSRPRGVGVALRGWGKAMR